MSNFTCRSCVLGYETTSANNYTCTKPSFKPHKGFAVGSPEQTQYQLLLHGAQGGSVTEHNTSTGTHVVLTGHAYTIPAPPLEPKATKFVGFKQPHSKIHYELDFSLGAEVDIGCDTAVQYDSTDDFHVPRDAYAHPQSMTVFNHQWFYGRPSSSDPGYFAWPCPRYHRFVVTRPGNFTFVRCCHNVELCHAHVFARPAVAHCACHKCTSLLCQSPSVSLPPARVY